MTGVAVLLIATLVQPSPHLRTLDRGDQSNMEDAKEAVVRTQAAWNTLWRQHSPDRPQPKVDFTREMVVGVFLGSRNTAGYALEIVSVEEEQGALVVSYRQRSPQDGSVTAQILTFPYHLVAVPRLTRDVRFQKVN